MRYGYVTASVGFYSGSRCASGIFMNETAGLYKTRSAVVNIAFHWIGGLVQDGNSQQACQGSSSSDVARGALGG